VEEEKEGVVFREADAPGHLQNSGEAEKKETADRPPFIDEDDFQYNQAILVLKALGVTAVKR